MKESSGGRSIDPETAINTGDKRGCTIEQIRQFPGARVRVRRVRADPESKEIDFVPVDDKPSRKTGQPGR